MTADKHIHGKAFIVIRAFFFYQMVLHKMGSLLLYDFLQDGLAIIKELFILKIVQNEFQNKLLCASKTTVQIDSSSRASVASETIESRFLPPVISSPFPRSRYCGSPKSLAQ